MHTSSTKYNITCHSVSLLSDLQTPVGIYLKIRNRFPESVLLESTDFDHQKENHSYIGFDPLARFSITDDHIKITHPDGTVDVSKIGPEETAAEKLKQFMNHLVITGEDETSAMSGVFGYCQYESAKYFDPDLSGIGFPPKTEDHLDIPEVAYVFFHFVIQINHKENTLILSEYLTPGEKSKIGEVLALIDEGNPKEEDFFRIGTETRSSAKEDFLLKMKDLNPELQEIPRLVLSSRYEQKYQGDDFKVYRALRSLAPSSYLFYFSFGDYHIFGSSPEPLVVVKKGKAYLSLLAGQAKRTGNETKDKELAHTMQFNNPDGSREHEIIVNQSIEQLSKHTQKVRIESYCELQEQAKTLHLVSRISGEISQEESSENLFAEVFPSPVITGTPKVSAMKAIASIETHARGIFGGCIGYVGFNGDRVQALIRRSFLSRGHLLYTHECAVRLQENKVLSDLPSGKILEILRKSLQMAETNMSKIPSESQLV